MVEWEQTTYPWAECIRTGNWVFEIRFLIYSLGYIILNFIGNECQRSYHASVKNVSAPADAAHSWKSLIASRPTVIAATFHSVVTSIIAVGILTVRHWQGGESWIYQGTDLVEIWQRVGLSISLSYFVTDCYFYCLPRKDAIIFVHHFIMCFCHYPVTTDAGAFLSGAGDREWVSWLSIIGYTSEVSTALMNYRWYLINTLEENWIGFGITNALVAVSWAGRTVMFGYLVVTEILPRYSMFVAKKQMFTYSVMVFGHVGIGLLSLYWWFVMCKGGLKSIFVFKKRARRPPSLNSNNGFSFADEVGRCDDALTSEVSSPIAKEIKSYCEGTLFDNDKATDNGTKAAKKVQ